MSALLIRPAMHSSSTELYIGSDLLRSSLLKEFCNRCKGTIILIADLVLKDLYATDLAQALHAELLTIPSGERTKTQEIATFVTHQLFEMGADRDTTLIALGGGMTLDLVGFVASTYMRGISLILIPTTLLAIVDASIGGKTAIDTPQGKNLIGTIYHPKAIFADLRTLETLPEEEWFNGLAEILKIGLIYHPSIWDMAKNSPKHPELIFKAVQGKINIIEEDPTERGLRRILNFGHTIAHALEALSHYEMPHGRAVALGCSVEAHLSMRLGYLSEQECAEIQKIYHSYPLKLPKNYERSKLIQAMSYDKKKTIKTNTLCFD